MDSQQNQTHSNNQRATLVYVIERDLPDYPGKITVQVVYLDRGHADHGKTAILLCDSLAKARQIIPGNYENMGRLSKEPDGVIESWVPVSDAVALRKKMGKREIEFTPGFDVEA